MVVVGYNCPRFRGTEDTALSAGKKEIVVDKSEIKEMPEGKSSEEIDAIMMEGEEVDEINQPDKVEEKENTDLAKEALEEAAQESSPAEESVETEVEPKAEDETTAEEKPKPEVDPKDAVIGDFRRKLRDKELENARLEGELKARSDLKKPEVVVEEKKSPLEVAEAEYIEEFGDLKGFAVSSNVLREELAFRDERTATEAAVSNKKTSDNNLQRAAEELQEDEFSPQKAGEGLDLQSMTKIGEKHLTEGDLVDIANTAKQKGLKVAVKQYYQKMVDRTLASGGKDAKLLQAAIDAKKGKSQTEPEKKKKTDIDALITDGEDDNTGEAEQETHSRQLTNFVFSEPD